MVSTEVPDVVADWSDVVHLAASQTEFVEACRQVVRHSVAERDAKVAPLRHRHEWDSIADGMQALLEAALGADLGQPSDLSDADIA